MDRSTYLPGVFDLQLAGWEPPGIDREVSKVNRRFFKSEELVPPITGLREWFWNLLVYVDR